MTVYRAKDGLWQPLNEFAWDLRQTAVTPETRAVMTNYLGRNSWVANNNNMGNPTEIEFQVKPRDPARPMYIAVVYAADADNPQYFPKSLKDDTLKKDLVYGNTPGGLRFDRKQWTRVTLAGRK